MIVKIHRAMHNCELPVVRSSSGAAARAESIGKALCAGLGAQLAVAQGTCVGGGFTLVQDYASAPQNARVHPASVMPRSEEGVRLVVFQGKQTDRNGGLLLTCVTSVDASWATAVVGQSNLPPSPHPSGSFCAASWQRCCEAVCSCVIGYCTRKQANFASNGEVGSNSRGSDFAGRSTVSVALRDMERAHFTIRLPDMARPMCP